MKDEEIEKALECCGKANPDCENCPCTAVGINRRCYKIAKDTLDYIIRLKAEKEQIRKETAKEILGDLLKHANMEISESYEKAVKGSRHYGGVNNAYPF